MEELPDITIGKLYAISFDSIVISLDIKEQSGKKLRKLYACYSSKNLLPDTLNSTVVSITIDKNMPDSILLSGLLPDTYYRLRLFAANKDECIYLPEFTFNTISGNSDEAWKYLSPLPGEKIQDEITFAVGGKAYLGLGYFYYDQSNYKLVNTMWSYTPETDTWEKKNDFPGEARGSAMSMVIDGHAYVIGGEYYREKGGNSRWSDVWLYLPETDTWERKKDMPFGNVCNAKTFVINGKGYLLGGYVNWSVSENLWEYDPYTDTWEEKASYPERFRYSPATCSLNGKGYAISGTIVGMYSEPDCWIYDPLFDTWERKNDLPDAGRANAYAFVYNNKICLIGGNHSGNSSSKGIEYKFWLYDPETNNWTPVSKYSGYPVANSVFINNKLYYKTYPNIWNLYDPELDKSLKGK